MLDFSFEFEKSNFSGGGSYQKKTTTVIALVLCNWVCIFLSMKYTRHNQTFFLLRQKNSKKLAKKNIDERMTYLVKTSSQKTSIPVHLTFFEATL